MERNVPKLRFPGFTGAWKQRKLSDVIDKLTGGASIAPEDYVDEGCRTIPKGAVNDTGVADMSGCKSVSEEFFKKNISSKTSTGELVTSLRDLVPTAPNMGRVVRICGDSEDFLMPQGVYSIILKENADEDFLIAYSNSPVYRKIISTEKNGSTQVHIRNGEFLNIDIPVPSLDEQNKIGRLISNIDKTITLHQRKCDAIKKYKAGMLQKMFPHGGEDVPEIRFPGFTDAWEQHKLGDVTVSIRNGYTYKSDGSRDHTYKITRIETISSGVINTEKLGSSDEVNSGYLLEDGDILFSHINSLPYIGNTAIYTADLGEIYHGMNLLSIRANHNVINPRFLIHILKREQSRIWFRIAAKPAVNQASISTSEITEFPILLPSIEEQTKIASFLNELDNLITLYQQELYKYKELKKGLLQQMFV